MPDLRITHIVDADGLAMLRRPRRDLLIETAIDDDTWEAEEGPFSAYRRRLTVADGATNGTTSGATDGEHVVTEHTHYRLAVPLWAILLRPLMNRALAETDREPRRRWWWPENVVTERTARLVASLCIISVMAGYLGVVIGQTITFAAEDFGSGDAAEANTLAAVRVGVLLSLLLLHRADRIGRRPLILAVTGGAIFFTMLGAGASSLAMLGVAQTIARGLTTGLLTLLFLAATEQVPAGVRAFSISLLTICAALGAGMVVWVLPINDFVEGGWRIVYLVPALFAPVLWWIARHLPETRRFAVAADSRAPGEINWRRFSLLGWGAFTSALFLSPASQLRNEFLRDDLGYSASAISAFQLVISAPAGVTILVAGIAADRFGRRWIGSIGLGVGAIMMALSFQFVGIELWLAASAGVVLTGGAFPATRGYQTELFPTRSRARVGSLLDVVGVAGSAVGLVVVGYLAERWDDLGAAIGVMVVAPILVAIAIRTIFPETAGTELETFNPGDPQLAGPTDTDDGSTTRRAGSGEPR